MASKLPSKIKTAGRLLTPLFRPQGASILLGTSIVLAAALTWSQLSVISRFQRNSTLASLLALEIKRESSPDLGKARQSHVRLINYGLLRMQDPITEFIGLFQPESSPDVQLRPVINILADGKIDDGEALKRAELALEKIAKLWSRGDTRAVSVWVHQSSARIKSAKAFIETFHHSADRFLEGTNSDDAERVCMDSRFATAMFLAAWTDYDGQERTIVSNNFAKKLNNVHVRMSLIAKTLPVEDQSRLQQYAKNIGERSKFLATLKLDGMPAARNRVLVALAQR